jgi:hypothetical protein
VALASACSDEFQSCEESETCSSSGGTGGEAGVASAGQGGVADGGTGSNSQAGAGGDPTSASGAAGVPGQNGEAGAGGAGPACDFSQHPRQASCLVSNEHSVFVSPDGDDDNAGTREAPLATLTAATAVASGEKLVLVCSGIYQHEHVSIGAAARVYGGFSCRDWSVEAKQRPTFAPLTPGPALSIAQAAGDVLIDSVVFQVADAVTDGASAIAALVSDSSQVTLQSVVLKAGKGKAGSPGVLGNFPFASASALAGNSETLNAGGGGAKVCACQPNSMSLGGPGGPPASAGSDGTKGGPEHGTPGGSGGVTAGTDCGGGGSGKKGADAPASAAATWVTSLGKASAQGWIPTAGLAGAHGLPGQGGGGGASFNSLGHGASGGCGGCGGNGGPGGQGGGGSIALLAVTSMVNITASTLISADAGNGGAGAVGQAGQQEVGAGGNAISSVNSCGGGIGGKGGAGGAGGGGAGGVSVGVLWLGTAMPAVSQDSTISFGKAGAKGPGGAPGVNDGPAGVAQALLRSVD